MKHSIILKSVAIVLAAVALLAAVGGAIGLFALVDSGLYSKSVAELRNEKMEGVVSDVAESLVREYIARNLSDMTENALQNSGYFNGHEYYIYVFNENLGTDGWCYAIREVGSGKVVSMDQLPWSGLKEYQYTLSQTYPRLLWHEEVLEEDQKTSANTTDATYGEDESTTMLTIPVHPGIGEADECMRWYNNETGSYFDYYLRYEQSPEYQVSIYLPPNYIAYNSTTYWNLLTALSSMRSLFLPCLLIGLAVFAVAIVYLIVAAGHGRGTEMIRLPLDLYTMAAVGGAVGLCALGITLIDWFYYQEGLILQPGLAILTALPFLGASVCAVGYIFALAAQFKTGQGFWWRNSIVGRCLRLFVRGCRWLWRQTVRLLSVMNTMWQWVLVGLGLCFGWFLVILLSHASAIWVLAFLFMLGVTMLAAVYGAYAFGLILEGARRMSGGDLNRKISVKYLIGCFADCAGRLNALADVAVVAARNQLKSERMKTELITNVSHDIKTPLTSIINYVDLLQKPHTEEEGEAYLAVLARQSGQMKKLIEDLMDMSKASTGNMAVDITEMDAVEAVNQALGEYTDKLAAVPLYPVIRCPEEKLMIRADGKLVWRVLSNLLQNAVKYALPGTRLYVDINRVGGNGVISLKNISREELNISADELMERFVRGDTSRNTEGSGLGLNIAKSLMELQKGQLRILVDGDLFKTSMVFPVEE